MSPRAAPAADLKGGEHSTTSLATDSLSAIASRLRAFREAREWERFHTPRNLALSIAIESGELLEHFQWIGDEDVTAHVIEHEGAVAEELADVAIYVVQLSEVLGISLSAAIAAKIERNEERYPAALARGSAAKYTELKARRLT